MDSKAESEAKANALTREKRREFMGYIKNGMTIGEAQEKAGIEELMTACAIINANIKEHHYLTPVDEVE